MNSDKMDFYFDTVDAIAASPLVTQFVIGYTSLSRTQRFSGYKTREFEHMVLLADRLSEKDAKELERYLQRKCRVAKRFVTWRKYHKRFRTLDYRPGTKSDDPDKKKHSVYMVWWQ